MGDKGLEKERGRKRKAIFSNSEKSFWSTGELNKVVNVLKTGSYW